MSDDSPDLDDLAEIHDRNAMREMLHNAQDHG